MQYNQIYQQNRLNPQILRFCGFQEGPSSFSYELYRAQPILISSCLRDTLMTAMWNFKKLQDILIQARTVSKWRFCHVILCTMPDKVSKINQKYAIQEITRMNSTWQVSSLKTILVPICMENMQQILKFCQIGGGDWTPIPATFEDFPEKLNQIMKNIRAEGNINKSPSFHEQQRMIYDKCETFYTALTFSVEVSKTTIGKKWQRIINSIVFQLRNLRKNYIISGIIYAASPWVISQINQKPVQVQRNQLLSQNLIEKAKNQTYGWIPPPPSPQEDRRNKYILYVVVGIVIIGLIVTLIIMLK